MCNLRVEELEPRLLLNGTNFSLRPPPSQPSAAGTFTARVADRSPFAAFGGDHAGPVGQGRPGEGGAEIGPSRSIAPDTYAILSTPPKPANSHCGAHEASAEAVPGTLPEPANPQPPPPLESLVGVPAFRVVVLVGVPDTARTDTRAVPPAPSEQAKGSRGANEASAEAVPGTLPELANPQPPPPLESLVGVPAFRVVVLVLSAAQSRPQLSSPSFAETRAATVQDGEQAEDGPMLVPPSRPEEGPLLLPPGFAETPPTAAQDGGQAEEGPVLPSPQVPGVLTVLPPLDLTAVQLGMHQFLDQMERMGQRLVRHRDGTGLYLWIVAEATAAMACEIARRQLRACEENGFS